MAKVVLENNGHHRHSQSISWADVTHSLQMSLHCIVSPPFALEARSSLQGGVYQDRGRGRDSSSQSTPHKGRGSIKLLLPRSLHICYHVTVERERVHTQQR